MGAGKAVLLIQEGVQARIFHELLAATTDMSVLPGVLECRPLRRTGKVRLGTNTLRLPGTRRKHLRCAWQVHLIRARCAPLSPASGFPVSWSRDSNSRNILAS